MKPIAEYLPKTIPGEIPQDLLPDLSSNTALTVELAATPVQRQMDIDSLDRAILKLAMRINAANFEFLCLVREFDERAGWLKWGLASCAEWLHWRCDLGLSAAREKIRVAHAIKLLPEVSDHFATGALSYTKVRAITRVATPENEHSLIEFALQHTTGKVDDRCRQMRNVEPKSTAEAKRDHERRSLRCFRDRQRQMFSITVDLPAETGELVMAALDKAMVDESLACASDDPRDLLDSSGSLGQDQADALVKVLQAYVTGSVVSAVGAPGHSGVDSSGSPAPINPYHVVLHVDQAVLKATERDAPGAKADVSARSDLPVETMRRICCDTALTRMVDDSSGQPLSVGRKTRVVPTNIKKALWSRDRCCRFPGCHHTRFVDAHHVKHWSDGGETSLDNLVLLCSRHHRLVHEDGYQVSKDSQDQWIFIRPDGRAVPDSGYQRQDVVDEVLVEPGERTVADPSREGSKRFGVRESCGTWRLSASGVTQYSGLVQGRSGNSLIDSFDNSPLR